VLDKIVRHDNQVSSSVILALHAHKKYIKIFILYFFSINPDKCLRQINEKLLQQMKFNDDN